MKVLIVTNMYPIDEHSYYGIFVKEYVESIESLGIKVDVFFVNGKKNRLEYFRTVPGIRKKIINGEYDIVHAQHTYCVYQIWFGRLFKASSYPPVMLTLHEGEVFAPKGDRSMGASPIKKLIYNRALKRWACRKADHIVGVEQKVLDVLRIQNPRSIIPPGVNIDLFKPIGRIECKQKIGSLSDGYVVFFPAKPTSLKGFHLLKESLGLVKHKVNLLVGGDVPRYMMPYYFNAADVVVQTSLFEASPMVIKEAMAVNVPIVTTDVGDSALVLGNTPGCFVCSTDPRDIARCIDQALDFRQRTVGRERIIQLGLSLEQVAKRYVAVYNQILSHGKSSQVEK